MPPAMRRDDLWRLATATTLVGWLLGGVCAAAEVAADQRQVAIGYDRLETLALRIADAVEATEPARADQIRTAIGEARTVGVSDRFDKIVGLLERERWASARQDQTELATQLEELLRLVMADPNAARLEEERRRLEMLQREIRAALREQRALRARAERGESGELSERQGELADRIERLHEPAVETDRLSGRGEPKPTEGEQGEQGPPGEPSAGDGESPPSGRSIAGRLESSQEAMRRAQQKLAEEDAKAGDDQREAQRELEAAAREAEERLKQLREEEQQRRLASLAERFRRMHEGQTGIVADLAKQIGVNDATAPSSRSTKLAIAKLAARQADVGSAAEQALRLVRADGTSRVFDDVLVQLVSDIHSVEDRLRDGQADRTSEALAQTVADAIAEMIAAVDDSLDELEQRRESEQGAPQSGGGGEQGLVSKIAELRMIRAIQARLMRQTEVWQAAAAAGEASSDEVSQRLAQLATEQRKLALAASAAAKGEP